MCVILGCAAQACLLAAVLCGSPVTVCPYPMVWSCWKRIKTTHAKPNCDRSICKERGKPRERRRDESEENFDDHVTVHHHHHSWRYSPG